VHSGSIFQLFSSCQQVHASSKTLHKQNPPVLNWRCWLTQVDLYNGRKTVVVVLLCIYQLFAGKRGDVHNTVKRTLASSS